MTKPDFSDPRTKLQRAYKHISAVEATINSYLNTNFFRLRIERRGNSSELLVDSLHQPDPELNALIGDAVSNLRSVLDYVAVAIVSPASGSTENIGFPFADNAGGFKGEVTKKSIGLFATKFVDHFINEVQAYKGGKGENFWILNKLRNIDKHRFLISTVRIAGVHITAKIGGMTMEDCFFGSTAGQTTDAILFPAGAEVTVASARSDFRIRLSEPPYIEQVAVTEFLSATFKNVEGLLNALGTL